MGEAIAIAWAVIWLGHWVYSFKSKNKRQSAELNSAAWRNF